MMVDLRILCHDCGAFRAEQRHHCVRIGYVGLTTRHRHGGFGERVAVEEDALLPLPGQISLREATVFELLAVARHAVATSGVGKRVQCKDSARHGHAANRIRARPLSQSVRSNTSHWFRTLRNKETPGGRLPRIKYAPSVPWQSRLSSSTSHQRAGSRRRLRLCGCTISRGEWCERAVLPRHLCDYNSI
jgi:hypothetical protein